MPNHNESAKASQDIIYKFIKLAMKERGISQKKLSEIIEVNESTLIRNFKNETEMSVTTLLKICGALKIRPYIVPAELDDTEMKHIFFN